MKAELDKILTELQDSNVSRAYPDTEAFETAMSKATLLITKAEARGEYNLIRSIEKLTTKMDDDYGEFDCLDDIEALLRERAPIVESQLKATTQDKQ